MHIYETEFYLCAFIDIEVQDVHKSHLTITSYNQKSFKTADEII